MERIEFKLDGNRALQVRRLTFNHEETTKKVELLGEFALKEITTEELKVYRAKQIPSFLLKVDGNLYYTKIPNTLNLFACNTLGHHKCSHGTEMCKHLSAASDKDGGCAKVRDIKLELERYPWITKGYQTFNTKHDSFVVLSCEHFENHPPREQKNAIERNRMRLNLAQYYWDDVTSLAEVRERKKQNKKKERFS